ncbi:hypothetical protein KQI61_15300 [Anaerocolumna aminovalerica]|uniref:hypothetical protein n=1 Tax=Anaerocolumna aminovalerica TaxID=1527 RepID=UPI001C0ED9E9|nr:hypothetical protein [Anaerocolumna aminovalerica]MBU5333565.1 hypothetical protein [Anaerocolumna aminovalerica]
MKQYVLTDGKKFIKINEFGDPVKTNNIILANVFESMLDANNFLQTDKMIRINNNNGKNKFNIKEVKDLPIPFGEKYKNKARAIESEDIFSDDIENLDDMKFRYKDNKHFYSEKTYMENEDFNIAEFMKLAIKVFSQLDTYIENMAYLEREIDLKILDIRHFKRDDSTKMNAIEAQSLEYYEQELERERIFYKKNRLICENFQRDINNIKDEQYINKIDNIQNSEYRYRRLSKEQINDLISSRKKYKLKVV